MYSLNKLGEQTYYMDSPTNVGFFVNSGKVTMIDGGSDKDAAKKALKLIEEQGWTLERVINTHSHADHSGGNALLKARTDCKVFAPGADSAIINYPLLEPTYLYGGFPMKEMRSKFVMAQPCECFPLTEKDLPEGMEIVHLDGHDFEQIGIKTPDDVWFVGDCVLSTETLSKYKISFLYDIEAHIASLLRLKTLKGALFVPSHCEPISDITALCDANLANVEEVAEEIKRLCKDGLTIDELLEKVFSVFGIRLYLTQYALIGCTTRSYLSWLCGRGEIEPVFSGTKLLWKTVK